MAKIWKCGGELRLSMLWFFIVRSHPVIIKILKIDQYTLDLLSSLSSPTAILTVATASVCMRHL